MPPRTPLAPPAACRNWPAQRPAPRARRGAPGPAPVPARSSKAQPPCRRTWRVQRRDAPPPPPTRAASRPSARSPGRRRSPRQLQTAAAKPAWHAAREHANRCELYASGNKQSRHPAHRSDAVDARHALHAVRRVKRLRLLQLRGPGAARRRALLQRRRLRRAAEAPRCGARHVRSGAPHLASGAKSSASEAHAPSGGAVKVAHASSPCSAAALCIHKIVMLRRRVSPFPTQPASEREPGVPAAAGREPAAARLRAQRSPAPCARETARQHASAGWQRHNACAGAHMRRRGRGGARRTGTHAAEGLLRACVHAAASRSRSRRRQAHAARLAPETAWDGASGVDDVSWRRRQAALA